MRCFVLAIHYASYPLMLIGRVIYGVGIESFVMAETPLLYEYFKGKELSFALGANLSFSRLGSSVNDVTTYWLYEIDGGRRGILLGSAVGLMLLIACLLALSGVILHRVLYNRRDLRFEELSEKKPLKQSKPLRNSKHSENKGDSMMSTHYSSMTSSFSRDQSIKSKSMDTMPTHSIHVMQHEGDVFEEVETTETNATRSSKESESKSETEGDEGFRLSDIASFDVRFWILVVNTCLIYGTYYRLCHGRHLLTT